MPRLLPGHGGGGEQPPGRSTICPLTESATSPHRSALRAVVESRRGQPVARLAEVEAVAPVAAKVAEPLGLIVVGHAGRNRHQASVVDPPHDRFGLAEGVGPLEHAVMGGSARSARPAGLAALVEAGIGLSVLPALAAGTRSFAQLGFRPLSEPALYRDLYIIRRRGRSLGPAAHAMLQLLRQTFAAMPMPAHVECVI